MWRNAKRLPTDDILIRRQQDLETTLAAFADGELRQATARLSDPSMHDASAVYLIRPSKRLLGMAFLHAARAFHAGTRLQPADLNSVAAALEIRHGAILLHNDIVDDDTIRGGRPHAHHALLAAFGTQEAPSDALFAGDVLAAAFAPPPILRTVLVRATLDRLTGASPTSRLHLDARSDSQPVWSRSSRAPEPSTTLLPSPWDADQVTALHEAHPARGATELVAHTRPSRCACCSPTTRLWYEPDSG
ncbi:polyprenyl synthetase family protein [Streptomyces sp. BE133]|uniref:polyprenyl synthetase family protein n=1 Tax=Streptomyces sp. BE133 TaxID=3002523 RepID=UPI002E789149|nr:polyprenyl synthetase family protein [Streptomyces sp. BE133]MEE1805809.1 polyprenyl synthetase family protein [Streptomyces sp. BE133]